MAQTNKKRRIITVTLGTAIIPLSQCGTSIEYVIFQSHWVGYFEMELIHFTGMDVFVSSESLREFTFGKCGRSWVKISEFRFIFLNSKPLLISVWG